MNHASTINPRVLVVDDDDSARNFVARALTRQGFQTSASEGGRQAISLLATESFDAIVCDLLMPEVDGLDVLRHCGSLSPRPPFIMLTAHGNVGVAVDAMKLGAVDFLEKPVSPTEIDAALRHAISRTKAPKSTRTRRKLGLVGSESWLRPFTELLEKVATSDAVVLIEGETGTGKSAVARQIYQLSGRAKGPFLAVNCANMTNSLLENELFGHVKGAFTGAVGQPGKVEKARGGTLFLDEIGELPPDLQPKLLQLLQERSFTPVGGTTAKDADVRFIAATNRELEQEALAGRFRPDLYYRLEVVKLTIPPLRQRLEDIPILLEHFRHFAVDEHGRAPIFPRDTVEALGRYPWPGNVRELENLVSRLSVMLADGAPVQIEDLPDRMRNNLAVEMSTSDAPMMSGGPTASHVPPPTSLAPSLDEVESRGLSLAVKTYEARIISNALEITKGNVKRAAELLQMKRTTLIEKRKRLTEDGLLPLPAVTTEG